MSIKKNRLQYYAQSNLTVTLRPFTTYDIQCDLSYIKTTNQQLTRQCRMVCIRVAFYNVTASVPVIKAQIIHCNTSLCFKHRSLCTPLWSLRNKRDSLCERVFQDGLDQIPPRNAFGKYYFQLY
jgi:hypothetical protein